MFPKESQHEREKKERALRSSDPIRVGNTKGIRIPMRLSADTPDAGTNSKGDKMKFIINRIDGKGKKFPITEVFADSYTIETNFDQCIPYSLIHFHVSKERMFREPVIGRISSLFVSGDVTVEQS